MTQAQSVVKEVVAWVEVKLSEEHRPAVQSSLGNKQGVSSWGGSYHKGSRVRKVHLAWSDAVANTISRVEINMSAITLLAAVRQATPIHRPVT